MIVSIPIDILQRYRGNGTKSKHISCRILGQLLTLSDLFILAISCFIQSRQGVTDVSKEYFEDVVEQNDT